MGYPRRLNIVSLTIYALLAVGIYASIKYMPIMWKKNELETLVKDHSFVAKNVPVDQVRSGLMNAARRQLSIELEEDDVVVEHLADRVQIKITWRPIVRLPFKKELHHRFTISRETIFY